jgi:predicted Zn finger-like uncharacterized protein
MPTEICPECGAKYRVPDGAEGRKAKCKKCGAVFVIGGEQEDDLFNFADAIDTPPTRVEAGASAAAAAVDAGSAEGYRPYQGSAAGGTSQFIQSIVQTFLFPLSFGNLITFVVLWVVLILGVLCLVAAGFGAGCFTIVFIIGWVIVTGWYLGYLFSVIESGAAGDDELPNLTLTEGFVDGVIVPMLKMLGSYVVAFLLAGLYVVTTRGYGEITAVWDGTLGDVAQTDAALAALRVVGHVAWPMVVLCIALGGFSALARVDLIALTVVRTFPVYLVVAGLIVGTEFLSSLVTENVGNNNLVGAAAVIVPLYLDIVGVRVIGIYYHHFKHRFAWDWG